MDDSDKVVEDGECSKKAELGEDDNENDLEYMPEDEDDSDEVASLDHLSEGEDELGNPIAKIPESSHIPQLGGSKSRAGCEENKRNDVKSELEDDSDEVASPSVESCMCHKQVNLEELHVYRVLLVLLLHVTRKPNSGTRVLCIRLVRVQIMTLYSTFYRY